DERSNEVQAYPQWTRRRTKIAAGSDAQPTRSSNNCAVLANRAGRGARLGGVRDRRRPSRQLGRRSARQLGGRVKALHRQAQLRRVQPWPPTRSEERV